MDSDVDWSASRAVLSSFLRRVDKCDDLSVEDVIWPDADNRTTDASAIYREHLVYPLLDSLGHRIDTESSPSSDFRPDFHLTNMEPGVIGVISPPNHLTTGLNRIREQMCRRTVDADYAVLTDGIEWRLYVANDFGDTTTATEINRISLQDALRTVARLDGYLSTDSPADADGSLKSFHESFAADHLDRRIRESIPRQLQTERQNRIDEFYQLYIELIFGESDELHHDRYLLDGRTINPPANASERDAEVFAVDLVNRLLFLKFLENEGVLPDGFLADQLANHDSNQDLYRDMVKPLLHTVFSPSENTDDGSRLPTLHIESLAETTSGDTYAVDGDVLRSVIEQLVQGNGLASSGDSIAPSILGSVFERVVNYISGSKGDQKASGAFYTPHDVTREVIERTLVPRVEHEFVRVFSEASGNTVKERRAARDFLSEQSLDWMLDRIERQQPGCLSTSSGEVVIPFDVSEHVATALERLNHITTLDPSCGSGHFLTATLDTIHRIQLSLLHGLNGESPSSEERYLQKRKIALHSLYGVDINGPAVELARLRIWLKIIETNGWKSQYDPLPRVDLNLKRGNSLIGLPTTGDSEASIPQHLTESLNDIRKQREHRKQSLSAPLTDEPSVESIRSQLDEVYLNSISSTIQEDSATTPDELERLLADADVEGGDPHPALRHVRVKRDDGAEFSSVDTERLEDLGFTVYSVSATLNLEQRRLTTSNTDLSEELECLLADGFSIVELEREPLPADLRDIPSRPFHWNAEFPELCDGGEFSVDVVIGNPPYGDILSDAEKVLTVTYRTGKPYRQLNSGEIAANFLERQLTLLRQGGRLGNVTTTALLNRSDLIETHRLARERMADVTVSSFARRPSKVFPNAEINVTIFTGRKSNDTPGTIRTSDFVRFERHEREETIRSTPHSPITDLHLRDSMGGAETPTDFEVVPMVGDETKHSILHALANHPAQIADHEGEGEHSLWYRRAGNYWMNAVRTQQYVSTNFTHLQFTDETVRDFVFLTMNTSLFYLYWITYGNLHDVTKGVVKRFPLPDSEQIASRSDEIERLADTLHERIAANYDSTDYHQFKMHNVKPTIDEIEAFTGDLYQLDERQVRYLREYHSEYSRSAE